MPGDRQALVRVGVAPNEALALMWREVLEGEGIPVLVRIVGVSLAFATPALAQHDLYARAEDAERASQIIAEIADDAADA